MLRLFFLCCAFMGLVMAQTDCLMSNPQLSLPSCMDNCFATGGCSACPCPQNLKGWCEMTKDGPDSWFSRWGACVVGDCPDDGDITNMMLLFTAQCEDTVGGPLNNDTVPYPLRDWAPKNTTKSTSATSSTATLSASQLITSPTTAITNQRSTPRSADAVATSRHSKATLPDETSSYSRAASTSSSAPATQGDLEAPLSKAAIIGIVVGGTVLLALVVGLVAFFLRRRRHVELSRSVAPPNYEGVDSKEGYDKPELDGQVLAYRHSEVVMGTPIDTPAVYAELDGGGQVSPARQLVGRS